MKLKNDKHFMIVRDHLSIGSGSSFYPTTTGLQNATPDGTLKVWGNLNVADSENGLIGSITASGDISASGNIYSANDEILFAGSFKYTSLQNGYYGMPGNAGINTAVWAYEKTDGATGLGATSQHIGIRVPYKCVLVGMMGNIRSDTASATVNMSCWTCELTNNTDNTWTKSFETTDITTAASTNKVMGYSDLTGTAILAAGTSVIPAILNDQGGTSTLFGSYTIVIRRII
jgi:hypothetical protein